LFFWDKIEHYNLKFNILLYLFFEYAQFNFALANKTSMIRKFDTTRTWIKAEVHRQKAENVYSH
jgi:hypothetical protein